MANMTDYLRLRADITLAERPFNDVDNLVLSTLAYVKLVGIAPEPGDSHGVTVREACTRLLDIANGDITPYILSAAKVDIPFLEALAASDRLGYARLHDYVDVFDEGRSLQFAAVCVDVSPTETYVGFRGTDNSLVGWREDFMLSFEVTDAQKLAADYLARVVRESMTVPAGAEPRKIYVGGHSKGGNLAAYAALQLPKGLRGSIARVWSNDGPGLAREVMPDSAYETFGDRFKRIQPAYSIVGQIFDNVNEPRTYVESSGSDALEHDPLTWQVTPTGFVEAEGGLDSRARVWDDALMRWVMGVPLEDREVFTRQLFDALGAGGATTINDIMTSPQIAARTLGAVGNLPEFTRQLLIELLSTYASDAMRAATETGARRLADAWNRAADSRARRLGGTTQAWLQVRGILDDHGDQRDDEGPEDGGAEPGDADAD